jgi:hypothetical protein
MSNPIDEYVKRNLANQEITPSKNLFADKIQPRIEQRKAAAFPFLRVAAAIVILLAAYAVVKLVVGPVDAQYQPQEITPFAIEEPQELESTFPYPEIEEKQADDVWMAEEVPNNMVAQEEPVQEESIPTPVKEALPDAYKTIAQVDVENQDEPNAEQPSTKAKKSYKVKIKIDPAKYGMPKPGSTEVASAKPTVGDYARKQFQNLKSGEAIEAPTKEMLPLPNVAVKFEGNPLKKILPGKE